MNQITLIGKIVTDVELNYTNGKEPLVILKFTIAVPRKYKKENENNTDFINCTAFGKIAEFINKYFSKGKMIGIVGELRINGYIDKNGEKRRSAEVLIEKAEFCSPKEATEDDN